MLRLLTRAVFALLPTCALLVAAEMVVRVTGAGDGCPSGVLSALWVCDPIMHFRMDPDLVINGQKLNSWGFRGSEVNRKRAGTYRVAALGDSCTFGFINAGAETGYFVAEPYPQRLNRIITRRHGAGKVEVLNLGVCGYNSYHGIMLLRTKGRQLQADLYTVQYVWNDLMLSARTPPHAFQEPATPLARGVEDVLLMTKLYPFARRLGMQLRSLSQRDANFNVPATWTPNVPVQEYRHNLRRIVEVAHRYGAQVWFLTSSNAFITNKYKGQYDEFAKTAGLQLGVLGISGIASFEQLVTIQTAYNEATRSTAAELGVTLIDMAATYQTHGSEDLFRSVDAIHPNQRGHTLEAEVLYSYLVHSGVIGRRPM